MLSVLSVTFPFFALVLCGYLATRRGLLPLAAIPGLNSFVLFFALPCMLYRFGASTPIAQLLDPVVLGVYLACALVVVGGLLTATPLTLLLLPLLYRRFGLGAKYAPTAPTHPGACP